MSDTSDTSDTSDMSANCCQSEESKRLAKEQKKAEKDAQQVCVVITASGVMLQLYSTVSTHDVLVHNVLIII